MENAIKLIKGFFEKGDWKYKAKSEAPDRFVFITGVNMNNALGNVRLIIIVRPQFYTVYASIDNSVEEKYYAQVSEYLHRANYGMQNGNFEFDYSDGSIRYKTFVNFEGSELSEDVITDSILVPIFMFDKYGKNLLRIMLGDSNPKQLIAELEEESDFSDSSTENDKSN